ncbi:hypothetical protein AVEN_168894-1 [Araneus ventricosus]|uniref:Integrase zinc-binding domain-containing protein n=1 Tax=Araneus ventricosus TaxID=182803 RepID=A0A4Y2PCV7_ARAVE|nr:hypothetical protein AVEN_168894-1 [Araneus ventricosus]
MSDSFEQHLRDLEAVFKRLQQFNLNANRDKCNFACTCVKYLGHWITSHGLEADAGKVSFKELREEKLKDDELRKIIECFEKDNKDEDYVNWTSRGYLMNQGVLYRFSPDSESEEAQLVVPSHERKRVLDEFHGAPTAGHYGTEGTYHRVTTISL